MMRGFLRSGALHGSESDVAAWSEGVRLSLTCGLSQQLEDPRLAAALTTWGDCAEAALKNAEAFLAEGLPS
jgi:hypothetical protein